MSELDLLLGLILLIVGGSALFLQVKYSGSEKGEKKGREKKLEEETDEVTDKVEEIPHEEVVSEWKKRFGKKG